MFKTLLVMAMGIALSMFQPAAHAATDSSGKTFTERMFPAGVSFDTFATAKITDKKPTDFGGGIGANAFFTRHIGIGVEAIATDPAHGKFLDEANGKAILRLPFGIISPNVFAGGGRSFESDCYNAFAGGGLAIKCSPHASLFADARYVHQFKSGGDDYPLVRAGLSFNF